MFSRGAGWFRHATEHSRLMWRVVLPGRRTRIRRALIAVGIAFLYVQASLAGEQKLRACYNSEFGIADAATPGIAILLATAKRLPGLTLQLVPLPWRRCIQQVIDGDYDAVVGISFTEERGRSLTFPLARDGRPDDEQRLLRVGYVLVRPRGSKLDWTGQSFVHLTGPLGTQRGYSVAEFARQHGAEVDEGTGSAASLLAKLDAGRVSGILISEPQLAGLVHDKEWGQKYEQGSRPLQQKAYFLAFSKPFANSNTTLTRQIWSTLRESRKHIDGR